MTEAAWLACTDPTPMLEFLRGRASARKLRLLAVACWYRYEGLNQSGGSWVATSASEQKAEMLKGISAREHKRTLQQLKFAAGFIAGRSRTARRAERAIQATLLRCLFGNPFRPSAPLPHAVLAWNDGTVRRIAEGIYQERAFNRMPVLADALLDAGCEDEALFQHCREPGSHVRGCWAVDLILGKS